jgi:lysophospholipase L1-like esterase
MRRRLFVFMACALAAAVLAVGCAKIDPISAPPVDTGSADFTRMAVLGNTVAAGLQNGGLSETHQVRSFVALLARQVGKQVISHGATTAQTGEFVIPGYGDPGSPGTVELTSLVPAVILPITTTGAPVNLTYQAPYNNLGVPAATLGDALNTVTSSANPYFDLVLRGLGTMIQQVVPLQPTFVVVELGSNDVLLAVTRDAPTTPPATFEAQYRQLITTLTGLATHPKLAAVNIPDVTTIPYATTVPPVVVNPATSQPVLVEGHMVPLIGPDGPLALTDLVTIGAISLMRQGVGIPVALGGAGTPLPDVVVLNGAELEVITQRVVEYNHIIEMVAAEYGFPVVDMNGLLRDATEDAIKVGGLDYTTKFVSGGAIGLDGIHPTDVGHALLANVTIRAINEAYGAAIPLVDLRQMAGVSAGNGAKPAVVGWGALSDAAIEALQGSPVFGSVIAP